MFLSLHCNGPERGRREGVLGEGRERKKGKNGLLSFISLHKVASQYLSELVRKQCSRKHTRTTLQISPPIHMYMYIHHNDPMNG